MSENEEKKPEPETPPSAEDSSASPEDGDDRGEDKPGNDILGQLEGGLEELKTMASELGDKLGSAATEVSDEAKETWKKMEPQVKDKLKTAESTLADVTDSAAVQLKGLFGELKTSLKSLKDKL